MESLDRNHQEQINKVNATVQHLIAIKIKLSTFFARFYLGQFRGCFVQFCCTESWQNCVKIKKFTCWKMDVTKIIKLFFCMCTRKLI